MKKTIACIVVFVFAVILGAFIRSRIKLQTAGPEEKVFTEVAVESTPVREAVQDNYSTAKIDPVSQTKSFTSSFRTVQLDDLKQITIERNWTEVQSFAALQVVLLDIPLDYKRFVEAVDKTKESDPSVTWGGIQARNTILQNYGPRDIWGRANDIYQKAGILNLAESENDLSELLDMPLGVIRAWQDELDR